ncbi:hypothetical protein PFISCL1PPCAC_10345 [Pristionchus fissidentatus]|uniref:C2H2-type domain-containing protein n=1 Tax=Pristionchus fissidentatus TaxID=1538716 RepID=A0AAV5VL82_9BILA|nr:hypothetical protein PFISCL1PPCAC_10345 [Pristionchus fissidentatus]
MEDPSLEVDHPSPNENYRSSRPSKKPYKELNLAEKVELIRLAEENVGLSQATIAERYSIAKSNVCRILQRKREYLKAFESSGFAASRKRKLKCRSTESIDNRSNQSIIHAPIPIRPSDSSTGNETLRAHMYKEHEVSRMFMCRCCNWAFPDKTSLHVHIQSKEEGKRSLHSLPLSTGLPSAFVPLQSSINSSPLSVLPPLPFSSVPPVLPPSDLLSRLHDRLLLNSLLTLPSSFSFPFLQPSTLLTTADDKSPSSDAAVKGEEEEEEDEEIEVRDNQDDGETPAKKMHLDTKSPVSRQSSLSEKRGDSPCDTSGTSSVFSPTHTDRLLTPSPSERQKEPFHSLNLDPSLSSSFSAHPHVSPSETHSTASPQCESSHSSCFDCTLLRARILSQDNKIAFLESRLASTQDDSSSSLTSLRSAESTVISLRSALLSCQEEALRFARCENAADSQAVMRFLNQILQSTIIR